MGLGGVFLGVPGHVPIKFHACSSLTRRAIPTVCLPISLDKEQKICYDVASSLKRMKAGGWPVTAMLPLVVNNAYMKGGET